MATAISDAVARATDDDCDNDDDASLTTTSSQHYSYLCQSARMSKILKGGLDQYGKGKSLNRIGSERVNSTQLNWSNLS